MLAHDGEMNSGFSVILAAHNEAAVIEGTIRSVLRQKVDGELQVIVVANGCSDDTAGKARGFGDAVEVIETLVGNKIDAINLGDRAAKFFPHFFLFTQPAIWFNGVSPEKPNPAPAMLSRGGQCAVR